ncbi:hypothetical protein ACQPXH_01425 [Nocardia sp. CA-135953]
MSRLVRPFAAVVLSGMARQLLSLEQPGTLSNWSGWRRTTRPGT